jgi:ribose 5-phosphate isomerase RpiB
MKSQAGSLCYVMIITARQLENLHRQSGGNGQLTLPYRARLTPLAVDWIRSRKITLGYSSVAAPAPESNAPAADIASQLLAPSREPKPSTVNSPAFLHWCDGPCGPAKAALVSSETQSSLRPIDKPADPKQIATVIKTLAIEIKSSRATGGILLVQHGAVATVLANRCPSLRAILGTSLEAVEQGIQQVAANVLVIEYPRQTLQQIKNMLGRFTRASRKLSEEIDRQIKELAACG